tara:strand:+ start:520798 stop:523908 length:3111 start_codon:yes stop_codon:yes gene_type:complete
MSKRKIWLRRSHGRKDMEIRDAVASPRRGRRLLVERLAQRRVLAAIMGEVFHDANLSLRREGAESALESRVLYLDANQNDTLDIGEPVSLSDAAGQFTFPNLSDGTYLVRLFNGTSTQQQTFPVEAQNQGPGLNVASGTEAIAIGPATAVLSGGSVYVGETATGQSDEITIADTIADIVAMPDGTLLAIGTDGGEQGAWLVDTDNQTVRPTGFMIGDVPVDDGGVVWSQIEIDTAGLGFALGQDGGERVLRSIDASDASSGLQVAASVSVPMDAQLLSSAAGPRSILAWAGDGGLELALWSNGGSQIGTNTVTLPGAAELLDFDDATGLLAVRSTDGGVSVHDVDGNFATLHTFADIGDSVLLDGSRELLMALSPTESLLRLIDLRDGSTLIDLGVNLATVGNDVTIAPGNSRDSVLLLGSAGVANVSLLKPGGHRVEVSEGGPSEPIRFGVNVSGDNAPPNYVVAPSFTLSEDTVLNVSAPSVLLSASDADGDSMILLQTGPAGHGMAVANIAGGLRYEPEQDFNGDDAIPVILHDGRDPSGVESIQIVILPVPDPPTLQSPQQPLPENAQPGEIVGPLTLLDPDGPIDDITVIIDDTRFEILNGQIIFVGGDLDFETETQTQIRIELIDEEYSPEPIEQVITVSIGDVNEPVTDIFDIFSDTAVFENIQGSYVSTFDVEDEDLNDQHTLSVDDSRFVFRGFDLYLADDETLDFERTPSVPIQVTATDRGGNSLTLDFTVRVIDEPEQAGTIELGGDSLVEFVPGDVVGEVIVDGVRVGSGYDMSVDDSRFEIVDSILKLTDDQFVELAVQSAIELTITAQDVDGEFDPVSEVFVIDVLANSTPFHNDSFPYDVNRSGQVTAADALIIINYLNAFGPGPVGSGNPAYGYDVNSDLYVTALDALLVLNYLNLPGNTGTVNGEGGEGETEGEGESIAEGESPAARPIDRRIPVIAGDNAVAGTREAPTADDPQEGSPRSYRRPDSIDVRDRAVLPQIDTLASQTDPRYTDDQDTADEVSSYRRAVDDVLRLLGDHDV